VGARQPPPQGGGPGRIGRGRPAGPQDLLGDHPVAGAKLGRQRAGEADADDRFGAFGRGEERLLQGLGAAAAGDRADLRRGEEARLPLQARRREDHHMP
jgi:hypothetical protein